MTAKPPLSSREFAQVVSRRSQLLLGLLSIFLRLIAGTLGFGTVPMGK